MTRTVNYYPLGIFIAIWGGLLGIVVIAAGWEAVDNLLFACSAKTTPATLISHHYDIQHGKGGDSARFFLQYRYTGSDGPHEATAEVQGDTYLQYSGQQGPLPIRFMTSLPGTSRVDTPVEAQSHTINAEEGCGVAAVIGALGGLFLAWQLRQNRINRTLRRTGVKCSGKVRELVVSRGRYGQRTTLAFVFRAPDGQEVEGQSDNLGWRRPNWKEGDSIQVYYNPQKPDQFCVDLDQPVASGD